MINFAAEITAIEWIMGVLSIVAAGAILSSIVATAAHIANSNIHPKKEDIVFDDVCTAKERTAQMEMANLKESVTKLEKTTMEGFREIKELLKNK